jgi:acyl carrier protein
MDKKEKVINIICDELDLWPSAKAAVGLPNEQISETTKLTSLGIDSLELQCIILRIRKEVGPINDKDAANANTVGALIRAIQ